MKTQKEQLLTSASRKEEVPKHKNALEEKYKYMLGQAHAYQKIDQEISNLLNPKEQKNESERPENVIKFGRDTEK